MREQADPDHRGKAIRRAWWLAMSGSFASWTEVADHLSEAGIADAHACLNEKALQDSLDKVCWKARAYAREL